MTLDLACFPIRHDVAGGVDAGATNTDVRFANGLGAVLFKQTYPSADFTSVDGVIDQAIKDAGFRPEVLVVVLAGDPDGHGNVILSNRPDSPPFNAYKTADRLGIVVLPYNDLVGPLFALDDLTDDDVVCLKEGTLPLNGPKAVVTLSSGRNMALLTPEGSIVTFENGWTGWSPVGPLEQAYHDWLSAHCRGSIVSFEDATSGVRGFWNAYEFLKQRRILSLEPDDAFVEAVRALNDEEGIAPLVMHYAEKRNQFAQVLRGLVAGIDGQYLGSACVLGGGKPHALYLIGSIIQKGDNADHLFDPNRTPLLGRFLNKDGQHAKRLAATSIFLITDPKVTVKGAVREALRMLGRR